MSRHGEPFAAAPHPSGPIAFTVRSRDGELIGYEIELAEALAEVMDVEIQFVERPFGQLMAALENGEIDAIMSGMTITPERNRRVAFVGPYLVSGKSILTKSATIAAARAATDIDQASLRIAALSNSTSQDPVESAQDSPPCPRL